MPSRDRKTKELKRISDSGNKRKSFASAKKQRDEVRVHNVCTEEVIQIFNNFY